VVTANIVANCHIAFATFRLVSLLFSAENPVAGFAPRTLQRMCGNLSESVDQELCACLARCFSSNLLLLTMARLIVPWPITSVPLWALTLNV